METNLIVFFGSIISLYSLEGLLYLISDKFQSKASDHKFVIELNSRIAEIVGSVVLIIFGMYVVSQFVLYDLNMVSGSTPEAINYCVFMLSFFTYHSLRVMVIDGYMRSLLIHHGLCMVGLIYCIAGDIFYLYPALVSLQSLAAILRNYVWLSRKFEAIPQVSKSLKKSAYMFVENGLTLSFLIHFLGWGMYADEIPWHGWAIAFTIAMVLIGLTFYWTMVFIKPSQESVVRDLMDSQENVVIH